MFSAPKNLQTAVERQSKVISGTEPAGSYLHEDYNAALGKGYLSQGVIASMDNSLRQTWRDLFDPQVKGFVSQNYGILRSMFDTYGDLRLSELEMNGRLCIVDPKAPSFKEFINGKPLVVGSEQKCLCYPGNKIGTLGFMSSMMDRSEGYFVVPVMNSGFYLAAEVSALLRRNGKSSGFALAGYSVDAYYHKNHYSVFRDGSSMEGKIYVAPQDLELIDQNRNKPMLIVDDQIATGDTVRKIEGMLRGRGVTEIYKVINDYLCLYL